MASIRRSTLLLLVLTMTSPLLAAEPMLCNNVRLLICGIVNRLMIIPQGCHGSAVLHRGSIAASRQAPDVTIEFPPPKEAMSQPRCGLRSAALQVVPG